MLRKKVQLKSIICSKHGKSAFLLLVPVCPAVQSVDGLRTLGHGSDDGRVAPRQVRGAGLVPGVAVQLLRLVQPGTERVIPDASEKEEK